MIVKPYESGPVPQDVRAKCGADAERQMAHYLHRRFNDDPEVCVLHGLRIVDREQPEQDGSPGVCQVDHLILHRWGMFIVESKSVTEEIRVRTDGTGGDEWTRVHRGKEQGMPSPIRQAQRQAEFLRSYLQRHRHDLVGRHSFGLRTIARVKLGTDQRGFRQAPMQLVIAISDEGKIQRIDDWQEPREPFQVFVTKADQVPDKIGAELKRHRSGSSLLATGEYGLWSMKLPEVRRVAEFLTERHAARPGAPAASSNSLANSRQQNRSDLDASRAAPAGKAACEECGATDLTAQWIQNRSGYYWRCGSCGANTMIPVVCPECGAQKRRGDTVVSIRKQGREYFRVCKACGASEIVWVAA
ncbi:MAG: NERD domain-containing protein [Rhodospirillales bacterium]|nr:NERD domain-containing protein [Rhodospirillales bacterium]